MKHASKFIYLDMLRGVAALTVLVWHVRLLFFLRLSDLPTAAAANYARSMGIAGKIFFFATSFGHEAVVVFFVLSGFFIMGSIQRSCSLGKWSPLDYAVSRLSRLWTVLLPALFLTWIWDRTGGWAFPDTLQYSGSAFGTGGTLPIECLKPLFLIGNALFLNTILVPCFGSNIPLWSLAYEFWYYVLFPLFFLAFRAGYSRPARLLLLVGALGLSVALLLGNRLLIAYFPIWLMGAIPLYLLRMEKVANLLRDKWALWAILALFAGILVVMRFELVCWMVHGINLRDYALGICTALLVASLSGRTAPAGVSRVATFLSDVSYTTYLVHVPLAFFLCAWLVPSKQLFTPTNAVVFACLVGGIFAYACVCWFLFERNTPRLRLFLSSLITAVRRRATSGK